MNSNYVLDTANALTGAVGTTAANAATTLTAHGLYQYSCDVPSWIAQGSNPTATAGAGSSFIPASTIVGISGGYGAKLSVLRSGAVSGTASITPIAPVR